MKIAICFIFETCKTAVSVILQMVITHPRILTPKFKNSIYTRKNAPKEVHILNSYKF